MIKNIDAFLIVKLLFIIGGIIIFLMGFFYSKKDKNKLKIKRCTKQTLAHITGFDSEEKIIKTKKYTEYRNYNTYHRKKHTVYYTPYLKFETESGQTIETKYPYPLERHLSNGQNILVKYNPDNPYDFYISGDKKIQISSTQAMVAGITMIIFGIFLLLNLVKL